METLRSLDASTVDNKNMQMDLKIVEQFFIYFGYVFSGFFS